MEGDFVDAYAGLFLAFACDGFLDGFARLDEACQRGVEPCRPFGLATHQAGVSVRRQHDHHRVGARKMLGAAGWAGALVTGIGEFGRAATIGAEAMALVPVDHGFRLRQDCGVRCVDFFCNRAQVGKGSKTCQWAGALRIGFGRDVDGKVGAAPVLAQEDCWCVGAQQRGGEFRRDPAGFLATLASADEKRVEFPERDEGGCAVHEALRQPGPVGSPVSGPIQRGVGKNIRVLGQDQAHLAGVFPQGSGHRVRDKNSRTPGPKAAMSGAACVLRRRARYSALGRLAADEFLANPVRSGRKQPQRVSTRVVRQPLTLDSLTRMASKKDKGSDRAEGVLPPARTDSAYRVLARKYRPQTFEDAFIGQSAMVRTLANAFAAGRIAHAFMLTGVRGVGKTTTARIIAKALNCIGPDGSRTAPTVTPCGVCEPCVSIAESRNVDVHEMDAASHTGIDDIREIIEGVRYAPAQARYKVYIIDEVHMLSKAAFNGLLKTLEEPPGHVKFAFATTEIRRVPITVLSRCQRFDLKRVTVDELSAHLARICEREKQPAAEQALRLIARAAEGSVRDALSLLDQAFAHAGGATIEEEPVRQMLGLADRSRGLELFEQLMRGAVAEALAEFRGQYDSGADPLSVMQDLAQICHEVTRVKVTGGVSTSGAPAEEAGRVAALAGKLAVPQLARTWQLLLKALSEVQSAPDAAAAAEMALIRIGFASELPPTEQIIRSLGSNSTAPVSRGSGGHSPSVAVPTTGLRSASSAGEASVSLAVSQPQAAHAPAPAPRTEALPRLDSFEDVLAVVREKREMRLLYALENQVHLVGFEPMRLEVRLDPSAPSTLPGEISDRLSKWTGARWIVTVSGAEGAPTIAAQRVAHERARREAAEQDPLLKAALAVFPGARLVAVRDRDALGGPVDGGDSE